MSRSPSLSKLSRAGRIKAGAGIALIIIVIVVTASLPFCSALIQGRRLRPIVDADTASDLRSFAPQAVSAIDISAATGEFTLKVADTDSGYIEVSESRFANDPKMTCALEGATLRIDCDPYGSARDSSWFDLLLRLLSGENRDYGGTQ